MTQEALLRMLYFQRFSEQRIVSEVDHSEAEIQAGTPIGIDQMEFFAA